MWCGVNFCVNITVFCLLTLSYVTALKLWFIAMYKCNKHIKHLITTLKSLSLKHYSFQVQTSQQLSLFFMDEIFSFLISFGFLPTFPCTCFIVYRFPMLPFSTSPYQFRLVAFYSPNSTSV